MTAYAAPTRPPLRLRLGLAVATPLLLFAQPAQGADLTAPPLEARSVVVSPPLCQVEAFSLAPFLDCLRVELAGGGLDCCTLADPADAKPALAFLRVKLEIDPCVADADRLQVSAREAVGPRMAARQVSLADVPETARPRALALAVAELIRSLGQGPPGGIPVASLAPAQDSVAASASSRAEVPRPKPLSIHVEAEARGLPTRDTILWGGRARLTAHRRSFHADFDLGGGYARARAELGDVILRSASVGLGFGPRLATGMAVLDLGLRAELGWAWIRGETALADVRTGAGSEPIANVGVRASLEVPAQAFVRPNLSLETGVVVRGVKGEVRGEPVAGMTGYYLLAALGIAVSL